ncbi:MAG: two-component regulator propeller domain-containing protein, partial [Chitinophagaceae bacterium]
GDIKYINGAMYFATASVKDTWIQGYNKSGFFKYTDNWNIYDSSTFKGIDSIPDFVTIAYQPQKGKLYGASFGGGLLEIDPQNNIKVYKYNSGLGAYPSSSGNFNVSGLAVDPLSNLWIANFGSEKQLHLLKPDGKWYSFSIPFNILYNAVAGITIDDDNLKWIISPKGNGLLVWNTGNLPEDPADDEWRLLTKGTGSGNLPSNNVLCAVKDRNGLIWVGTDKGIGIINCRTSALSNICDAILPVVNSANQTGYLFQDQKVNVIAIDGANRKWIGTSNGLWLISDDGEKVIQYFNIENSSLLSNEIYSLALNPITGELFIATSNGICSYRANATENVEEERKVLVFPNPVPPAYSGVIAIRGLPENSWVKITEINGRLVYQGKSLGGQMIWNGKDGNGRSVSSGVYLVLSKDDMNQDKVVTKIFLTR